MTERGNGLGRQNRIPAVLFVLLLRSSAVFSSPRDRAGGGCRRLGKTSYDSHPPNVEGGRKDGRTVMRRRRRKGPPSKRGERNDPFQFIRSECQMESSSNLCTHELSKNRTSAWTGFAMNDDHISQILYTVTAVRMLPRHPGPARIIRGRRRVDGEFNERHPSHDGAELFLARGSIQLCRNPLG